jgi:hypothetical protein
MEKKGGDRRKPPFRRCRCSLGAAGRNGCVENCESRCRHSALQQDRMMCLCKSKLLSRARGWNTGPSHIVVSSCTVRVVCTLRSFTFRPFKVGESGKEHAERASHPYQAAGMPYP